MVMNAKDAISGSLGECYVNVNGTYEPLINLRNVKISYEKSMAEVPRLGTNVVGNKSGQVTLSGTAELYYNSPRFRKLAMDYINKGIDTYFDMKIINHDPVSGVGQQVAIAQGCNITSGILAKLDVESETLDEEIKFTVENVIIETHFTELEGGFTL